MTKKEYAAKVATFDQDRINFLIDQIPKNINPTGATYKKRVKQIYEKRQIQVHR
jgi:hypothetical protein